MGTSAPPFPVLHNKVSLDIKGNRTDVVICGYDDHFLVIATQIGSMGTILHARKDEGVLTHPTFHVSVAFGKRDEPMLVACGRQLIEHISNSGSSRPLVLSLGLKDHSVETLKSIVSVVTENRLWIDMLLQGGLRVGHLTELVGPSSSGKTQVCLQVASSVAKKHMGGVVFFDTGNSFSPKRIAHFISQTTDPTDKEANHKILRKLMSNISCHSVFDFFTLMDVLHQLNTTLRSQAGGQVKLLIVDSISSLITPILGGRGSHGHALMVSAGFLLKKLAHEHNLCVIVTNHMVGGEGGVTKPALGESWKSLPHLRLQLSRDHRSNICDISILRHTYLASGKAVKFMILRQTSLNCTSVVQK